MAIFNMSEKYAPQIQKSYMLEEIAGNYAATSDYYRQRQKMFHQVLKRQADTTITSFTSQINDSISKLWESNTYKVLEELYSDEAMTTGQKINQINATFGTSPFVKDFIEAIKKPNYNLFKGRMGQTFEKFINERIFTPYFEACSAFARGHLNSIVSGGWTSLSSVVKSSKNIRADNLVYLDGITFKKDQGVLKESAQSLPLELQRTLTIDMKNSFPGFEKEDEVDGGILKQFLGNGDFFGFSAKVYNANEDNKQFSQSGVIQKALNNVFWYPSRYSQNRRSWEIDYAEIYVIWNLSRILKTIVSPTTIAMIYGNSLMWMSQFFQKKVFYMNIGYRTRIGKHNAGTDRIFPQISSPSILTKNFNINKGFNALTTMIVDREDKFNRKYKAIEFTLT